MRVQLKYDDWPAIDRDAWETMTRPGDIFDDAGTASHWSLRTLGTNRAHYGCWLHFLETEGMLAPAEAPWARVSKDIVHRYVLSLRNRVSPRTVASMLIGLKCVVLRMAPDQDWRWLKDLTNRLDAMANAAPRKPRPPMPPLSEMYHALFDRLETLARAAITCDRDFLVYRDTLIAAILCVAPVRLRNLSMIRIGVHLQMRGDTFNLFFEGNETKTRQPIDLPLPPRLNSLINFYLKSVRSRFTGPESGDRLWVGAKGAPLGYQAVHEAVRGVTKDLFGTGIGPHRFRELCATFLAESSASDALHARPLLGHRRMETTEKHFIHAQQIEAGMAVAVAIDGFYASAGHKRQSNGMPQLRVAITAPANKGRRGQK